MTGVGGVILAAGRSTRLGGERPKQLLEVGGEPLVRRVAQAALGSRLDEIVVVLGHRGRAVGAVLGDLGVRTVENRDHAGGQSTSVRAGLAALSPAVAAAMFLPADQPLLTSDTIDRLIAAWSAADGIVVPANSGRRGSPVIFGRELFFELEALRGDTGGRSLLARYEDRVVTVEVEDPTELADVDTIEDLRRVNLAS